MERYVMQEAHFPSLRMPEGVAEVAEVKAPGDKGDVYIKAAGASERRDLGVHCGRVVLITAYQDLSAAEVAQFVDRIIFDAYESTGPEVFMGHVVRTA